MCRAVDNSTPAEKVRFLASTTWIDVAPRPLPTSRNDSLARRLIFGWWIILCSVPCVNSPYVDSLHSCAGSSVPYLAFIFAFIKSVSATTVCLLFSVCAVLLCSRSSCSPALLPLYNACSNLRSCRHCCAVSVSIVFDTIMVPEIWSSTHIGSPNNIVLPLSNLDTRSKLLGAASTKRLCPQMLLLAAKTQHMTRTITLVAVLVVLAVLLEARRTLNL